MLISARSVAERIGSEHGGAGVEGEVGAGDEVVDGGLEWCVGFEDCFGFNSHAGFGYSGMRTHTSYRNSGIVRPETNIWW